MTVFGAFLLKNPPAGYKPAGWTPAPASKAAATTYDFTPGEVLRTPTFYLMWVAYALGCAAGLMVISQLVPFAKSVGIPSTTLAAYGLVVGAVGNASGRILSGWMSDHLGRINVLRLMIGISMVAMPILYFVGGNVVGLFVMLFIVYWCYGTQLSVNGATAADFWGTKNAGHQLRDAIHCLGCGRPARWPHRRLDVRQVPQLPDGVLHGGGAGGSCPALRTGSQTPGSAGRSAGRQESASAASVPSLTSGRRQWQRELASCETRAARRYSESGRSAAEPRFRARRRRDCSLRIDSAIG